MCIRDRFNRPVNEGLMHQAVVLYLASLRRGTHAVKNRSAVSGGGKKPYRQDVYKRQGVKGVF